MKPSLARILYNDWLSLFVAIGAPGIWVIYFVFPYLRPGADVTAYPAAILSALCIAVLAWRILRVHALFARGIEAPGVLTRLKIVRDRGRFEYAYQAGTVTISSWCPVHKSKQVMGFHPGDNLTVLYDPSNPKKSIVRDLFEKK